MDLLDLRATPVDDLPNQLQLAWNRSPGCMLTVSRRPGRRWTKSIAFAQALVLSSAPLYELILWLESSAIPILPTAVVEEQSYLLQGYHSLFSGELEVEDYLQRLLAHIQDQERQMFPAMATLAPVERALRELGYEHQGLSKGAENLRSAVAAHQRGKLEKAARERLDLDFYHLLEHHIERERDAVIPAWKWLEKL